MWPLRAAALPEKSLYQDLEARRTHLADHDGLGGREGGRAVDSLLTAEHLTVRGVEQHLLTVVQSAHADEAVVCRHHQAPHLGGVDVVGQAAVSLHPVECCRGSLALCEAFRRGIDNDVVARIQVHRPALVEHIRLHVG